MLNSPAILGGFSMVKETALIGVPIAVGATVVINPHAAIGAAIGCCFFLAAPWGSDEQRDGCI